MGHKIIHRDHLLVIAGVKAAEMACAGNITIDNANPVVADLTTFITFVVNRYIELDADMDFDEYIENNLMLAYS